MTFSLRRVLGTMSSSNSPNSTELNLEKTNLPQENFDNVNSTEFTLEDTENTTEQQPIESFTVEERLAVLEASGLCPTRECDCQFTEEQNSLP